MAYFPMSMPRHSKAHYWDKPASLFLYVRSSLTAAVPISRFYTNYAQIDLISLVCQITASFPGHLPFLVVPPGKFLSQNLTQPGIHLLHKAQGIVALTMGVSARFCIQHR